MRVMVLVDKTDSVQTAPSLSIFDRLDDLAPEFEIGTLFRHLDPGRIQIEFCGVTGPATETIQSLKAIGPADPLAVWRLRRLLKERDIELLHVLGSAGQVYAGLAGALTEIPVIGTVYRVEARPKARQNSYLPSGEQLRYTLVRRTFARIIAVTDLVQRDLARGLFPPERLQVILPAVTFHDRAEPVRPRADLDLPDGPLVLMVGAASAIPSFSVLLDALPILHRNAPTAHALFLASGTPAERLRINQQIHKRPGLPVTLLPEGIDPYDVLAHADVVVIHPFTEGLPMVAIEAAAAGKPIVAARMAGITTVVQQDVTGTLFTPGDARDMAVQIGRFILQPDYMHEVGTQARQQTRQRFSAETQRHSLTILYEEVLYASR